MNQVTTAVLASAIATFTVPILGDVPTSSPIRVDEYNKIDDPGSYGTTVWLRVIDTDNNALDATVYALQCTDGRHSFCRYVADKPNRIRDRYHLYINKASNPMWIVVESKPDYDPTYVVLPDTYMGTIDLGSLTLEKRSNSRDELASDYHDFNGALVDENENPVQGLRIYDTRRIHGRLRVYEPKYSDARGRVRGYQVSKKGYLSLHTHVGDLIITGSEPEPDSADEDFYYVESIVDAVVKLKESERITVNIKGKKDDAVTFSLYDDYPNEQHSIPLSTLKKRLVGGSNLEWLIVNSEGHLSRLVKYPEFGEPLVVDFSKDKRIRIRVTGSGAPLSNARVDVVEAAAGYRSDFTRGDESQHEINSLTTDESGRITVRGDPDTTYVAYVSADGYGPRKMTIRYRKTNTIDLPSNANQVTLLGITDEEVIRVKIGGSQKVAYYGTANQNGELTIRLARGTYDATVLRKSKGIVRGRTFEVRGGSQAVDLSVDSRPLIEFSLPPLPPTPANMRRRSPSIPAVDSWTGSANRRMQSGGSIGAMAATWTYSPRLKEPIPIIQENSDGTPYLRLSGTGKWYIYLQSRYRSLDYWLFTEIKVDASESRILVLPNLGGSITGDMHFDTSSGFHIHGIAGPRMMLLPKNGGLGEWNIVIGLPSNIVRDQKETSRFQISNLPVGEYRVEHQLEENYEPGWGGIPVTVEAGMTVNIGSITSHRLGPVNVEVVDAHGKRVSGSTLQIRDRMYESWDEFSKSPSTAVFASYPLREPPRLTIEGSPVTLHSVREGWLELVVDDQMGIKRHYLTKVPKSRNLRLLVP